MPLKLLVRATNSPTFPAPGSWAQGEIVNVAPDTHIYGRKEQLPYLGSTITGGGFIRVRITNVNSPDLGWLQEGADGGLVNRRASRMDPAQVEIVKAQWADPENPGLFLFLEPDAVHVSYNRAQFNSRIVTRQ